MNHNYAVILAGGQGNRFWPLSRSIEPKQFLSLFTTNSLLQETLFRIKTIIPPENIYIVTNQLYSPEIFDYISEFKIPRSNILFEPEGKNTAASICLAASFVSRIDPQARIIVLPSDHRIGNLAAFRGILRGIFSLSEHYYKDNIIIFGIRPTYPATGYGYIKIKSQISSKGIVSTKKRQKPKIHIFAVEKFIEKPDLKLAKRICRSGRYFWNSGMLFGYADTFINNIKRYLPELSRTILRVYNTKDINKIWRGVKSISFDRGVLERARDILMIPILNLGWSDLGSWSSLDKIIPKDHLANAIRGDVITFDSRDITVFSKSRLIACLGLENIIIVDTPDALLVMRKDKGEEIKKVIEQLKKSNRDEIYLHKTVRRSWGRYTVLERGMRFKIKLVELMPHKALTLQSHMHRSEHWVVLEGKAKVTKSRKIYYINVNESTFIPPGCTHRLENPFDSPLKILEVQSGDYLEEDDIVRFKIILRRKN